MTRRPAAELLAHRVRELVDEVTTSEQVRSHRTVRRGDRTVPVADMIAHRTREPGLLDQLSAIAACPVGRLERVPVMTSAPDGQHMPLTVPVLDWRGQTRSVLRWQRDPEHPERAGRAVLVEATTVVTRLRRVRDAGGPSSIRVGAAVPGGSPGWDADGALAPGRRGTPTSRAPVTEATWLLMDITDQVRHLYADVLAAAAAAGIHEQARGDLAARLRHIVGLVLRCDERLADRAAAAVQSWTRTARELIGYDAPVVQLRDLICPDCSGALYVRADASSAVWCGTIDHVAGPALLGEPWPVAYRCGLEYPRHTWLALFKRAEEPAPVTRARQRLPHGTGIEGHGGRC